MQAMQRLPFFIGLTSLLALLSGCSFLSSYTITFTTVDGASIDPAVSTLDFVVNAPVLAYLSEVECQDSEDIVLLPVVTEDMQVKTAYNLSLSVLTGQAPGTECDLTVTAFDQTTTATGQASIELVIAGEESGEQAVVPEEPIIEENTQTNPTDAAAVEMPAEGTSGIEDVIETQIE